MKILFLGMEYEHYHQQRGRSFEYYNFYLQLKALKDIEVIFLPFDRILKTGRRRFNDELLDTVKSEKPDLVFAFMFTNELDAGVLRQINRITRSAGWFGDDYWRFYNYSRNWASHFTAAITTSREAVTLYHKAGHKNVILSQWGCNTAVYAPRPLERDIETSFVGRYNAPRKKIVNALLSAGVPVRVFGSGSSEGRVEHSRMLDIFSRSRINLNINARPSRWELRVLGRLAFRKSMMRVWPNFHFLDNFQAWRHFSVPHIHARPFELAGCRGMVISGYAKGMENYYQEDREMVFYRSTADLMDKIRYYKDRPKECESIARAGYERTIRDHTYEKRFEAIFNAMGLR